MSDSRLVRRLEEVARRQRRLSGLRFDTVAWLVACLGCAALALLRVGPTSLWWSLPCVLGTIGAGLWIFRRRATDLHRAAIQIEQHFPDLDSRLLTAVGQEPSDTERTYSYLQEHVLTDVVAHSRQHPWTEVIATSRLRWWKLAQTGAMVVFMATAIWAARTVPDRVETVAVDPQVASDEPTQIVVEPGNIQLELGRSLIVTARYPGTPPASAELVTIDPQGEEVRLPLSRSLDDTLFGGRIAEVRSDLTYFVDSAAGRSADYRVTTFEYPTLLRADAIIVTPAYTGRGEQRIEDVRRVSILEGATLTLVCRFNKPLVSASLKPETGDALAFGPFAPLDETADDTDDVTTSVTWQPTESQTLELNVADDEGRGLRDPVVFHVKLLPNRPPELAVKFPSRDTQASPLEELSLEATAWDDFGVQEYGLVVQTPAGEHRMIPLGNGTGAPPESETMMSHLLTLEELQPQARDLLSYSFYADDLDARGEVRRTFGDVFFAEVRHFDEEYREQPGQPQSGGGGAGGGQQNPAQQLVDLQRQIVIAAWNSFRAWPADRVAGENSRYREETKVIEDSQVEAQAMLGELIEQRDDPAAKQHATLAGEHMTAAVEQLNMANTEAAVAPLTPARNFAQSAYQELLRLRDRLHVVQQQQGGGGGGGGGGQGLDRQLSQLELRNDRNRYEQERQAENSQQAQNREQLQVLNRLRELAQRQEDLNERIKELDDRKRIAQTDAEREEIERELKRLREEQQELLRNADELSEQMSQSPNQREMAEARNQLEQTRSEQQRASEALEEGESSRALTSGTRAQQRLEEMKEDFRRRSAGAFDESIRELQDDVRELADTQRTIGQELEQPQPAADGSRPSLRDTDRRAELGEELAQQQERLSSVLERMREIIEESEQSEPLLSERLYDAVRKTRTDQPEEALETAEELLKRGFVAEGTAAEQQARAGIENIEEGINRAAESILGDELETLERAQAEVNDLARAIQDELAQADPSRSRGASTLRDEEQEQSAPGSQEVESPIVPAQAPDSDSQNSGRTGDGESTESQGDSRGRQREGRRPGNDGESQSSDEQSDQSPGEQTGSQAGEQNGQRGEQSGESGEPGGQSGQQGESGQQGGQSGEEGGPSGEQGQSGQGSGAGQQPSSNGGRGGGNRSPSQNPNADGQSEARSIAELFQEGGPESAGGSGGGGNPLTGEDFTGWSDRLREVEDMLSVPELRAQAGSVRERARDVRRDFKRHSRTPDWDMVRTEIYGPLMELQTRLAEEVARRRPQDDIVPIDRDPVPAEYTELVREYYERLSRARPQRDRAAAP